MDLRAKIYDLISDEGESRLNHAYDAVMLVCIVLSIIPLMSREDVPCFPVFEKVSVSLFIFDYISRWLTADLSRKDLPRWKAFLLYPFRPMAIIDLLSIIPSFTLMNEAFKAFRLTRLLKVLRVFKFFRYSKNLKLIGRVLRKEKSILLTVLYIALAYIFISALIIYNVEEADMFATFFDALYWSATTLTTVGYGDIVPLSTWGRVISMFSSLLGVAVIALPSGVITAAYMEELRNSKTA